jgi:hypothetical protein
MNDTTLLNTHTSEKKLFCFTQTPTRIETSEETGIRKRRRRNEQEQGFSFLYANEKMTDAREIKQKKNIPLYHMYVYKKFVSLTLSVAQAQKNNSD